jgi:AcrR family transcriptional regulator
MEYLHVHIRINSELYLKDPESTELGKRIITKSIELIDEVGFEGFNFKKLGKAIGSPESSVYRYFDSKHSLLVYLTSWYWSWVEYKIVFGTVNQPSARQQLKAAILILTEQIIEDNRFAHINEVILKRIVISESTKVFHTKGVDVENEKGNFEVYKRIIQRLAEMISEINPNYKYPQMLVSSFVEGVNQQYYFCKHLPSITDKARGKNRVYNFYSDLIFKAIT